MYSSVILTSDLASSAQYLSNTGIVLGVIGFLILLLCSALISGSEVAFFGLRPAHKVELSEKGTALSEVILKLTDNRKELLATILITNNFVNVMMILISSLLSQSMFNFSSISLLGIHIDADTLIFLVNVISVTFIILLFGEVTPKMYASKFPMRLAYIMGFPLFYSSKFLKKIGAVPLLVRSTRFIDKRINRRSESISVDELSHALEITDKKDINEDEKRILSGIVKFGTTDVKQIMTPRIDVVAVSTETKFSELIKTVVPSGFSRIPVYEESFDQIKGILYLKDLLPHIEKPDDFRWVELLREAFYVPENKKIDDLLKEFQDKKIHMAIVVDEYGGSSGIVTLEDVIEEIVGEISDEFDEEDEISYSKLDENNYVFEGKTALNDIYRVMDIDGEIIEKNKGESDTLAGFVLELTGKIPQKNEKFEFDRFLFTIESSDKRRVKRVKITCKPNEPEDNP